jgi:precorrin-6B methylase 1
MDAFEISRRNFLHKLGLTVGAAAVATTGISGTIKHVETDFGLSAEQVDFMTEYDKWMDAFIEVIRKQKIDKDDIENNKRLVALTEMSANWQSTLAEYMQDENFAKYYMVVSERMTKEIE